MLLLEPDALEDFYGLDISNPNSVVVGLAPSHFCFKRLNEAFKLLLEGADLIAVHKAKYYKRKDGLALGPGPFVTGLEYATGKQAVVVGKPEKEFFRLGVSSIGDDIDIENTVMIGDDVTDDIIGAINAGMKAILVRTGKYRKGDECCIPIERRNCVDSFVDAVDLIESGCIL